MRTQKSGRGLVRPWRESFDTIIAQAMAPGKLGRAELCPPVRFHTLKAGRPLYCTNRKSASGINDTAFYRFDPAKSGNLRLEASRAANRPRGASRCRA